MEVPSYVAQMSDITLDTDLQGLTVAHVVSFEREVLVELRGGSGMLQGNEEAGPYNSSVWLEMAGLPDHVVRTYLATLDRWRDDRTELRLLGAPEKMYALTGQDDAWLALPR
jgi:hypothetical protein